MMEMEDAALQSSVGELAKKPSAAFSHEQDVRVNWMVQRGCAIEEASPWE
jgi:hypothetical protein